MAKKPFFIVVMLLFTIIPVVSAQTDNGRSLTADDVRNLRTLTLLNGHDAPVVEMRFSQASKAFVTTGIDNRLCVWNVDSLGQRPGQLRVCLNGYMVGVSRFAISPDGRQLAVAFEDDIALYNVGRVVTRENWDSLSPTQTITAGSLSLLEMQYLADNRLVTTDLNGQLRLFDVSHNRNLFTQYANTFIYDDGQLFVIDDLGRLLVIAVESGIVQAVLDVEAEHVVLSGDGTWLATLGDETQIWQRADLDNPALTLDTAAEGAAFAPDGSIIVTWEGDVATFWSLESGEIIQTVDDHLSGVATVAFNNDGRFAISINGRGKARFWRIGETGRSVLHRWLEGEIDRILVSPDRAVLVTTRESFEARFYNFETAQIRGNYPLTTQDIFSPDWSLIASSNGSIVSWIGRDDDPRQFAWMPFGFAQGQVNLRETPSQDQPRIGVLAANTPLFALGVSEDQDWVKILLPDDSTAWIDRDGIRLADGSEWNDLDVVE